MKSVFAVLLSLVALFIFGCSSREQKALESFKPVVVYLSGTNFNSGYSDFSYNVQKTDSLVSPFIGIITFKEDSSFENYKAYYAFTCHFAEQDGKWVHKSIDIEHRVINDPDPDLKNAINDEVRYEIRTQNINSEKHLMALYRLELDNKLSIFLNCPKIDNE